MKQNEIKRNEIEKNKWIKCGSKSIVWNDIGLLTRSFVEMIE